VIVQSPFGTVLGRISQVQPHLPAAAAVLIGVLALAAAAVPGVWQLTTHVNTMAHEGAHATMASAVGRKVTYVRLAMNGSGRTRESGGPKGGTFLIGLAGYLGPSAFGLTGAKLIQVGHSVAVLWLAIALLGCLLSVTRGAFGILAILATGFCLYLVAVYTPLGTQVAAAYGVTWFLLLSGVRAVAEYDAKEGDAANLRSLTLVPNRFWLFLWLAGSVTALGFGAVLLV
jgi:Peptidase M50B-like